MRGGAPERRDPGRGTPATECGRRSGPRPVSAAEGLALGLVRELVRSHVGQLADGGCLEFATRYHRVAASPPRHSH